MKPAAGIFGAFVSASYIGYKFTQPVNNEQNKALILKEHRREKFETFTTDFQQQFVQELQKFEKKKFVQDDWSRDDGKGEGKACVVQNGTFFEKAGVNTTRIEIPITKNVAKELKKTGKQYTEEEMNRCKLYANGVSLVIHPINPFIPTIHATFRIMQLFDKKTGVEVDSWFGGGSDLCPNYLDEQEPKKFHKMFKSICDDVDQSLYPKLKKDCDQYFYLNHRQEHRGLGGIMWEDFQVEKDWNKTFEFVNKVAFGTRDVYLNILKLKQDHPYNDKHLEWKEIRRGRYAEFNLSNDRDSKFKFYTPIRDESILNSLPIKCRWDPNFLIQKGREEDKMMEVLKNPRDWV